MKTALLCHELGVDDLMVVHDSFAATLGNIDKLTFAVRRAFVDLYKDYNLYEDFRQQCADRLDDPALIDRLPPVPKIRENGTLDLEGVLESEYCFS
jgi:DNA-directed RNA polymerase